MSMALWLLHGRTMLSMPQHTTLPAPVLSGKEIPWFGGAKSVRLARYAECGRLGGRPMDAFPTLVRACGQLGAAGMMEIARVEKRIALDRTAPVTTAQPRRVMLMDIQRFRGQTGVTDCSRALAAIGRPFDSASAVSAIHITGPTTSIEEYSAGAQTICVVTVPSAPTPIWPDDLECSPLHTTKNMLTMRNSVAMIRSALRLGDRDERIMRYAGCGRMQPPFVADALLFIPH